MPYLGRTVVTNLADYHVDGYTHVGSSPSSSQFIAGTTSALTLTNTGVEDEQALSVYFNGLHQQHNTYTISNSVVTFDAAIPTGTDKVEIHYGTQPVTSGLAADSVDSNQLVNGSIDTAHIGDDQVTLAKMASGIDGNIISYDASGNPVAIATGTAGHFLKSQGAGSQPVFAAAGGITLSSEQATTSGSSVTFGSIPTGTKRITIMLEGFSTGAANLHSVRIGDAGGIESSGYLACHAAAQHSSHVIATADFGFTTGTGASHRLHGVIILHLKDASNYTWIASSIVADHTGNNDVAVGGGSKSLSAELTQVQVLTAGTMGYGSIAINYE